MADGSVIISTELETKQFDKQIEKLKADLERYMRVLESDAEIPISLRMSAEERRNLETTIEKTKNQLISLEQQAKKTGDIGEEAGEKSGRGFDKGLQSLKRFALGLFGIRTAFNGLRRAANAYLAENEVTANKMNAIWVALGNALGPIIEIIANGVLKLIGYLNVFLNALGIKVDLTKNIGKNTKAIKEQTKAQKELNRQTAQFDEMNIVSNNKTANGGGIGGTSDAFSMPELDERIVSKLKDLAHWLKENWDWIWKVGVALGAVFGLAKISGLLGNIGKLIGGNSTGLLGLTGLLKGLLALELITITIAIVYYSQELKKVKQDNEDLVKWNKSITKENDKVNKSNLEKVKTYEKGSKAINDYVYEIERQIEAEDGSIKAHQKENKEMSILDNMFDVFGGTRKKNNELTKESTQRIIDNVAKLQELAKEGKLTDEQMKLYNQTMAKLTDTQKAMTPFIDTNSFMFDKETLSLYKQIDALKQNEKQFTTTINKNKNNILDIYNITKAKFSEMAKLKATPTIEFKANTKKLTDVFDTLVNSIAVDDGVRGAMTATSRVLKKLGLAQGGIVNLPGRGVPLSNVVAGEATGGAEGVIPLNNEESMSLIGQSIAKYVNINLTNNTMLDGKVIAREQRVISNNINFATNGRGVL